MNPLRLAMIFLCLCGLCATSSPVQARPSGLLRFPVTSLGVLPGVANGSPADGLPGGQSSLAKPIRPPCTVPLGTAHGGSVVCSVRLVPKGMGEDDVWLEFQARDRHGRQRAFRVSAGDCFGDDPATLHVSVGNYLGLNRKQVLVSASYGRTTSNVFDCDGRRVRAVYARDEGRVGVRFEKARHGQWRLVEEWSSENYLDDEDCDLGTAFVLTPTSGNRLGTVRRFLHWNGRRFTPDRPGPTRIAKRGSDHDPEHAI